LVKRRSIRIEILLPSGAMDAPALFAFFEFADDAKHKTQNDICGLSERRTRTTAPKKWA
jgi:hypothetical protein